MAYSAGAVANYILDLADQDREPITHMKLQKLVYLAHGWYLAFAGEPLINEPVKAWKYGPVIAELYREFKFFGGKSIEGHRYEDIGPDGPEPCKLPPQASDERDAIRLVWNRYKHLSAIQLSGLTHQQGTPWDLTWNNSKNKTDSESIANEVIKDHFVELAGQSK